MPLLQALTVHSSLRLLKISSQTFLRALSMLNFTDTRTGLQVTWVLVTEFFHSLSSRASVPYASRR